MTRKPKNKLAFNHLCWILILYLYIVNRWTFNLKDMHGTKYIFGSWSTFHFDHQHSMYIVRIFFLLFRVFLLSVRMRNSYNHQKMKLIDFNICFGNEMSISSFDKSSMSKSKYFLCEIKFINILEQEKGRKQLLFKQKPSTVNWFFVILHWTD